MFDSRLLCDIADAAPDPSDFSSLDRRLRPSGRPVTYLEPSCYCVRPIVGTEVEAFLRAVLFFMIG